MAIFTLAFGGRGWPPCHHQVKREVAPVDLNHIQPIVRLRLGPLTFYHPYRKGLLWWLTGGGEQTLHQLQKHTPDCCWIDDFNVSL